MRVLLCPGPFAGALTAVAAARVMEQGWRARATDDVTRLPLSDGGHGVVETAAAALGGDLASVTVPGPSGRGVPASVLHLRGQAGGTGRGGGTAVIEAAQAIGPDLVAPDDRAEAATNGTSEGLGRLLREALSSGASRVVVGLGPSAVHDAGAGLLRGLGLAGAHLDGGGAGLTAVGEEDLAGLAGLRDALSGFDLVVACATGEPLVGLHGAGAGLVQRTGMDPMGAQEVDRAVAHFADLVARTVPGRRLLRLSRGSGSGVHEGRADRVGGRPASRSFSGAGGGAAVVLEALGARLLDGAAVLGELVGLPSLVRGSDLVVTGCDRLDSDAVHSGIVATVGVAALRHGVPVVAVAGAVEASRLELARIGIVGSYALRERPGPFGTRDRASGTSAFVDEHVRLADLTARVAGTWSRS